MLKVNKQIAAEGDQYLFECFEESNFISDLVNNNFSIVLGRKGSGKTALARYLQEKYFEHGITFATRISIPEMSGSFEKSEDPVELIIFFILTRTIQLLLENNFIETSFRNYWKDFLTTNGLESIEDYQSFTEWSKSNSYGASLRPLIAEAKGDVEKNYERTPISNLTGNLFNSFKKSIFTSKKSMVFVDDISDYLDRTNSIDLIKDINIIRDVVLRLDKFNTTLQEDHLNFFFITCLRDDLFDKMSGSNINKLENTSLRIQWSEISFCKLLIRRLAFFEKDRETALLNPVKSIQEVFPNDIFNKKLSEFLTKRYQTSFYAYMMAISFNRPRDFLKFCYCMRNRLSTKDPVIYENIEASETEYSDYLFKELKDELELTSTMRGLKPDSENIQKLMFSLNVNEEFSYGQLKTDMGKFLETKMASNKSIQNFIKELWNYGVLGYKDTKKDIAAFKYFGFEINFLNETELKNYRYLLHRGLKWALRK